VNSGGVNVSVAIDLESRGARHCCKTNQRLNSESQGLQHTARGSFELEVNALRDLKLFEKLCSPLDAIVDVFAHLWQWMSQETCREH
jgi:hypothetical protein